VQGYQVVSQVIVLLRTYLAPILTRYAMTKKISTDKEVQALSLPQGKTQQDYFHKKEPGFGIRVSARRKAWFVMYSQDGKRKRFTLSKPYPLLSLADALIEARRKKGEILDGADPSTLKQQAKSAPTFLDICETYLEKHAAVHKKASSAAQDKKMIYGGDFSILHDRKAHEISGRDIVLLLDKTAERAPILANRQKALLHKIFKFTLSRHDVSFLAGNPVAGLPSPAKENPRSRVYNDEEIKKLWNAFGNCRMHLTTVFKLLLITGQRSGEVVGMRWSEVDLDTALWSLPGERTKNGRAHLVPLSKTARDILEKLHEQTGGGEFVFPRSRTSGSGHVGIFRKDTQLVAVKSGVKDFRPHDLRRTMATLLARKCLVDRFIQDRIFNHVDASVAGIYDRYDYLDQKRVALNKLDAILCQMLLDEKKKVFAFQRKVR
jgi:integrase